jgi:hypothetical protein
MIKQSKINKSKKELLRRRDEILLLIRLNSEVYSDYVSELREIKALLKIIENEN